MRKVFGIILLIATVGIASCQGLFAERAQLTIPGPQQAPVQPSNPR